MRIINKIKDYSKVERNVIIKKRIRPIYLWLLVGYCFLVVFFFWVDSCTGIVIDIIGFPLNFTFSLPIFDGIRELFLDVPIENFSYYQWLMVLVILLIVLAYATIFLIVFVIIPCLFIMTRYENTLDKIYIGDDAKTLKWREKYGSKEEYLEVSLRRNW